MLLLYSQKCAFLNYCGFLLTLDLRIDFCRNVCDVLLYISVSVFFESITILKYIGGDWGQLNHFLQSEYIFILFNTAKRNQCIKEIRLLRYKSKIHLYFFFENINILKYIGEDWDNWTTFLKSEYIFNCIQYSESMYKRNTVTSLQNIKCMLF